MRDVVPFSPPAEVDFDAGTRPYWEALREGALSIQRCAHCHAFRTPPSRYCPHCRSTEDEWPRLSGRARLYTYTIVALDRRDAEGPVYVAGLACPEEAPDTKVFCNIVDCTLDQIVIDMPLELVATEAGTDAARFRPAPATAQGGR
ncbi:Zn-ribbon domain-containing OB-fold protein [Novosphingobium album (ex Liu et al. 2023)]|uniref:Zinc ribbon domain-containing protein n=1 Tax=Novosphingobium album (ex Liu et al. 2023) TaxID=3031130 RepID=A0ABT5WUI5_9SPHN|nr:zinc ribbon domain-containing protein [Novosphingobium album (ex Liu et al. 2023)]MDE8653566.1 zinc ribbon domain-containing protein [Novosphingobium album (ex Liu et al. 2023)]